MSAFVRPAFRLAIGASPTLLCGVGMGAAFLISLCSACWGVGALFVPPWGWCVVVLLCLLPCGFVRPFVFSLGGLWPFPSRGCATVAAAAAAADAAAVLR